MSEDGHGDDICDCGDGGDVGGEMGEEVGGGGEAMLEVGGGGEEHVPWEVLEHWSLIREEEVGRFTKPIAWRRRAGGRCNIRPMKMLAGVSLCRPAHRHGVHRHQRPRARRKGTQVAVLAGPGVPYS